MPPDVAIDAEGRPTTDPHAVIAVTPLGGESYGHTGYAMALMVDLLCGPLNGALFGNRIPPMFKDHDARRRADGIPIEPALAEEIRAWSRRLGVPAPV